MTDRTVLISTLNRLGEKMLEIVEPIDAYVHYNSWREFGEEILKLTKEFQKGSKIAKFKLKMIFVPTSDWDDSGGIKGFDPDNILKLLESV